MKLASQKIIEERYRVISEQPTLSSSIITQFIRNFQSPVELKITFRSNLSTSLDTARPSRISSRSISHRQAYPIAENQGEDRGRPLRPSPGTDSPWCKGHYLEIESSVASCNNTCAPSSPPPTVSHNACSIIRVMGQRAAFAGVNRET